MALARPRTRPPAPTSPLLHAHTRRARPQIRTIKLPVLFLGGARDELVPPQQFARLVAACPAPLKRTHLVADGGHNDTFLKGGHDYYKAMNSFFKEARKFQPEAQDGGDRHH